jgi:NAD(P)-dependent dehydrogenase (short-subunit alcohol dehydrogenase family)
MAKRAADWGALNGRIAVITGGGSGMGRELCRQLSARGCQVSFADLSPVEMEETRALCEADAPPGTRVSCHVCDVSKEEDVIAFRDAVVAAHGGTDVVHYVFNNAGIAGLHSFLDESPEARAGWETTFNVDWYGVYYSSRAFIPLLKRADEAALVNTSSINGFWASLGPGSQHSACAYAIH